MRVACCLNVSLTFWGALCGVLCSACVQSRSANGSEEPERGAAQSHEEEEEEEAAPPSVGGTTPSTPSASAQLPTASAEPVSTGPLLFAGLSDEGEPADSPDAGVAIPVSEPTSVLVILDKSGSMASPWSSGETRWVAANQALIGALAPGRAQLTIGAILFPLSGECAVSEIEQEGQYPFMPGPAFIDTWTQTIRRNGTSGGTPLALALAVADRAIANAGDLLGQRFFVLLITDGEPTCMDDLESLERLPAQWLARGIETHVMGLPGSEAAAQLLDRIAAAGGSASHLAIGSPDQLETEIAVLLQ